jgi:transketolase
MGSTHHALEDLAVLRTLPNMTVVSPGDPAETEAVVRAIAAQNGPCYLRLGKAGEPRMHAEITSYRLGDLLPLREGTDALLLVTGNILPVALQAADALQAEGMSVAVISVPTVKPLDVEGLRKAVSGKTVIATVEEHSAVGGLGSAVAEALADMRDKPPHLFFSAPDSFAPCVGSQNYLRERAGLTASAITDRIRSAVHP